MTAFKIFDSQTPPSNVEKNEIINFLHTHLQEYGDSKKDIQKAIDYSIKAFTSFGGFTMLLKENNTIICINTSNYSCKT